MKLKGIHFILTYMCNLECDHCFLYCSPFTKGTFSLEQIKAVLAECKKIKSIKSVGFEGGEPFLFYPLLLESVRAATEIGYSTSIETNNYWATGADDAVLWLKPLKYAGLSMLELSDDAFHHGKYIHQTAKNAITAAKQIGLKTYKITIANPKENVKRGQVKGEPIYVGTPKFRGRAVRKLTAGLATEKWETFTECPLENLENPDRVHLDSFGNVHLCQGLSMGNLWETPLSKLLKDYQPDKHPICGPLVKGGPAELARTYQIPDDQEFVDACHLCSHISSKLVDTFPQYLTPRRVHGVDGKQNDCNENCMTKEK